MLENMTKIVPWGTCLINDGYIGAFPLLEMRRVQDLSKNRRSRLNELKEYYNVKNKSYRLGSELSVLLKEIRINNSPHAPTGVQ